jgi:septum formation protein
LFLQSQPTLILASTSAFRRELLKRLELQFEAIAPQVNETPKHGELPRNLVTRLARQKAQAVAAGNPDAWVIGSDQIAVRGSEIRGKPVTKEQCTADLLASSGQTLEFLTAVAVVRARDHSLREFLDTTRVQFRLLNEAAVSRYVNRELPLDCAGGFKSEGLGITLFESIDSSDPTALIGLPLIALGRILREIGFVLP